jgi:NAD-dependent deacetylase sirtuin 2
MGTASCSHCGHKVPVKDFAKRVKAKVKDVTGMLDPSAPSETSGGEDSAAWCQECRKLGVRNDIVLFGQSLPPEFSSLAAQDMPQCDLLIVAGTSLTVAPANGLVSRVRDDCARVVINREPVGIELGLDVGKVAQQKELEDGRDVFLAGNTDEITMGLIQALGWEAELVAHISATDTAATVTATATATAAMEKEKGRGPVAGLVTLHCLKHSMAASSAKLVHASVADILLA